MSKRNRREHGRILSVETKNRGDSLADDFAAGVTSITVNDAGDFDEDGGWLYIGAQTVEYTECDDDTGVIALVDPLAAAAEQGDPVSLWSNLYDEVVDYQLALVELDGEYDNPDPVAAEVAEGVGELPEGDRGKAGESCTLLRVADDEWEVVGVGGRPRQSQSIRFEQDDFYVLTAEDVTTGVIDVPLSHRPIDEALTCYLAGVPQRPVNWTIDYDVQALTLSLSGWERAGDVTWVHYAYRKGVTTEDIAPDPGVLLYTEADREAGVDDLSLPAGLQVGDLILKAGVTTAGHSLNPGADYTLLEEYLVAATSGNSGMVARLWWRLATQADVDAGAQPEHTSGNDVLAAAILAARGVTIGNVAHYVGKMPATPLEGGPATVPDVSVSNVGALVVTFGVAATGSQSISITAPNVQAASDPDPWAAACVCVKTATATGNQPGGAVGNITEENAAYVFWKLSLEPSG